MSTPSRNPYADVKRTLRREVGFQCPVRGCGNPYLTWHHFDPPWRIEKHHRPEGMIALCLEHASKADHGAFTDDQLRTLKVKTPERDVVTGKFDWRRQDFLVRLGGNFSYREDTILQLGSVPCAWLSRDQEGLHEVNFLMPTVSNGPRASIVENFWSASSSAHEIISPPMGRKIEVKYQNGDYFKILFRNVKQPEHLGVLYPEANLRNLTSVVEFPTTLVEVTSIVAGTNLELGPNYARFGGGTMRECFSSNSGSAGMRINLSDKEVAELLPHHESDS